jgi:hypothetical protein
MTKPWSLFEVETLTVALMSMTNKVWSLFYDWFCGLNIGLVVNWVGSGYETWRKEPSLQYHTHFHQIKSSSNLTQFCFFQYLWTSIIG